MLKPDNKIFYLEWFSTCIRLRFCVLICAFMPVYYLD